MNAVLSFISFKELKEATKNDYEFFLIRCFIPLIGYMSLSFTVTFIFRKNIR